MNTLRPAKTLCSICSAEHQTEHLVNASNGMAICGDCINRSLLSRTEGFSLRDPISATITRCRDGQPLVTLDGRPFNGLEIRPHQLERMASLLTQLATLSKRHSGKHSTRVVLS